MNRHTAQRKISNGNIVFVHIENGTWTEEVELDGIRLADKVHTVNHVMIVIMDASGKVLAQGSEIKPLDYAKVTRPQQYADAVKRGCVGMLDKAFISAAVASAINEAMAEAMAAAPKTAEQIAIETAAADAAAATAAWQQSPAGQAAIATEERHERLMRAMERADSDY